jgi:flagellar motor switch protein FliN
VAGDNELPLPQLTDGDLAFGPGGFGGSDGAVSRRVGDLARILDVPVTVSAVLGHVRLPVNELLKISPGTILELDRKVGEPVDILVNDRLVARGEVVLVDDRLGVTMTEIVRPAA